MPTKTSAPLVAATTRPIQRSEVRETDPEDSHVDSAKCLTIPAADPIAVPEHREGEVAALYRRLKQTHHNPISCLSPRGSGNK